MDGLREWEEAGGLEFWLHQWRVSVTSQKEEVCEEACTLFFEHDSFRVFARDGESTRLATRVMSAVEI